MIPLQKKPLKTVQVAADFSDIEAKLGIQCGFNPPPLERMRFVVSGLKGTGKTSLAANRGPRTLILDLEDTAGKCQFGTAKYVYVPTPADLLKKLSWLEECAMRGKRLYDHVVFDTGDALQDMAADVLTEDKGKCIYDYGTKGKGWDLIRMKVAGWVKPLYRLGYGWTINAHVQWTNVTDERGNEVERLKSTMAASVLRTLRHDADYLCQLEWKLNKPAPQPVVKGKPVIAKMAPERVLVMQTRLAPRNKKDAELSARIALPDALVLPYSAPWAAVDAAYTEAVELARKAAGK